MIDNGQAMETKAAKVGHCHIEGSVFGDGDDVGLHEIGDPWLDVTKKGGVGEAEAVQYVVNPCIGMAAAAWDDVLMALQTFKFGVGDGRDDGVHVGVFVANDKGLHGLDGCVWCLGCYESGGISQRMQKRVAIDFCMVTETEGGF